MAARGFCVCRLDVCLPGVSSLDAWIGGMCVQTAVTG